MTIHITHEEFQLYNYENQPIGKGRKISKEYPGLPSFFLFFIYFFFKMRYFSKIALNTETLATMTHS